VAAALALLSSLLWGTSDFLGGTAARRAAALAVVGGSQLLGLIGISLVAAGAGEWGSELDYLPWAVAGGLVGMASLGAFYAALASGTMGVVAPIAALGVVIPVGVGLASGERPSLVSLAGIAVAVLGVVLASGPELSGGGAMRPLVLAALAAVGFGVVLVLVARGADTSPLMTLVGMRATSVTVLVTVALAMRSVGGLTPANLPLLAALGAADVGANWAYGEASTQGLESVVAVLGSLYPAVTVLLARGFHGERMAPVQNAGVAVALAGVVLIATGGGA
jgi:drug/metabolite transporter (DMT)-like permease